MARPVVPRGSAAAPQSRGGVRAARRRAPYRAAAAAAAAARCPSKFDTFLVPSAVSACHQDSPNEVVLRQSESPRTALPLFVETNF